VAVEQESTRQVARELGISQTRVCQVVERVKEYLLQVTPARVSAEDLGRQCNLARQIAAAQVQHLYRKAGRDYEASKGEQTVVREVQTEGRPRTIIRTTKSGIGDVKLLDRACKFALLGAKLPVPTLASLLPDEEAADDEEVVTAEIVSRPSEEDCSLEEDEQQDGADEGDEDGDVTDDDDDDSEYLTEEDRLEYRAKVVAHLTVQAKQRLVAMGYAESEVDELLQSPGGEQFLREYAPATADR
jgi:biotin operon repressor